MAKWYNSPWEAIAQSIQSFVKRISRDEPVLLEEGFPSVGSIEPDDGDNCADGIEFLTAAEEGRVDVVRQILEADRDMIVVGDSMGDTALHMAARAGHCDVVLEMIRIASSHGQLERCLIDQNAHGDTPLHLAIKNRRLEVAQCLVDNACKVTMLYAVDNNDGEFPEQLARQYGYTDLVSSMPEPEEEWYSSTVDIAMVLRRRALEDEVEKEDMRSWDNLRKAIRLNQEMVVMRILGENPSLIQHFDIDEGNVFHVAALGTKVGMIRCLVHYIISNISNPGDELAKLMSITDSDGNNPLLLAIHCKNMSAALYLTEVAIKAMFQSNDQDVCPLYIAVEKGHNDLLSFMINQAQLSESITERLRSHAVETCLAHTAIKSKHLGILRVLMKKLPYLINSSNAKGWKPLSYAASKGYLNQASFLLTNFPNATSKLDKDGSKPIHKAIAGGHILVVKEFIAQCPQTLCDIDQKGRTTLHIATRYRKAEILCYLLKQNDVKKILHARDKEGNSFQDLANEIKNSGV